MTESGAPSTSSEPHDHPLDDVRDTERPWSSAADIAPPKARDEPPERRRRERPVTVTAQLVVVEGSDGEALQQRQLVVIRRALTWLIENPESDDQTIPE